MTRQIMVYGMTLLCIPTTFAAEMIPQSPQPILPTWYQHVPDTWRPHFNQILQDTTIKTKAGPERLNVGSDLYHWLVDHPDRTATAWRRLGVQAVEIQDLGNQRFVWKDEHGGELTWQTVVVSPTEHVWYATGKVKPGPLLPLIPVKAIAVLHHEVIQDREGRTTIRQWIEAHLQTESRFAQTIAKVLGPATPKLAEQAADQLLLFFGGIARQLTANPERKVELLAESRKR